MTYQINNKPVSLKQFSHELTLQTLHALESFEAMSNEDLLACASDISEITEYLESINEQLQQAKEWQELDADFESEHQRIELAHLRRF